MKHKSGLHKKVSSIFDGVPVPDSDGSQSQSVHDGPVDGTSGVKVSRSRSDHREAVSMQRLSVRKDKVLTEEQEYQARQKKAAVAVGFLIVVFLCVLYFSFFSGNASTTTVNPKDGTDVIKQTVRKSEIHWPEPEPWPEGLRDRMVYEEDVVAQHIAERKVEGPVLLGIVDDPAGRSSALIGKEILYEGDEIGDWTVMEIHKDIVRLEKADGEKRELRMKDRL